MCGKFTQMASWAEVVAIPQPLTVNPPSAGDMVVVSTPMRFANIMRLDAEGWREMIPMRWGFSKMSGGSPGKPDHMHARCETIDIKPTFARAFARARGILMVATFNEGEELPSGKTKQWTITPSDGQPIAIAVIWEAWRNGEETLLTFVQVTTPANALISRITDRMPAVLRPEDHAVWLGEAAAPLKDVKAVLRTFEDNGAWEMTEQAPSRPPRAPGPARPGKREPPPGLF